jgi:predicted amidophosphoribosyltransferase
MAVPIRSGFLLDLFLDRTCAGCGQRVGRRCPLCTDQLASSAARPARVPFDGIRAGLPYDGLVRRLVVGLKYRGQLAAVEALVDVLERTVRSPPAFAPDLVTWAPTSAARRRGRGVDQAQLLARALARRLGVPCRPLLRRISGPAQTGRGRSARLLGPCFVSRPLRQGVQVLVVDDVVTTGATMRAATGALRSGGAGSVLGVAVAATPDRPAMAAPHR